MQMQKLTRHLAISMATAGIAAITAMPVIAQTGPSPSVRPGTPGQPGSIVQPGGTQTQPSTPAQPGTSTQPSVTPGTAAPSTGTINTRDSQLSELLQQISQTGSFTTLSRAVEAAGLNDALGSQDGSFTILAPTDDAFAALPQDKLQRLLQPENRALLQRLLAYHVVPGAVTSSQIQTGNLRTLGGGVAVRVTSEGIVINNASVVQPDIQAENGVVHVISQVLMPEELRQQILDL